MNYCVGDELFLSDKQGSVILRVVPHVSNRTNADRIRAISDEELARDRVYSTTFEDGRVLWCGDFEGYCISDELAVKLELDWLQKPAPKEGEKND